MDADRKALAPVRGMPVIGSDGEPVGEVVDVFTDQLTDRLEWVVVRAEADDDDRNHRFVPLAEAAVEDAALRVPYGRDHVFAAPDVGGAGHLNVDDEAQLYVHYGLEPWEHGAMSGGRTGGTPTGVPLMPHTDGGPDDETTGDDGAVV